MHPRLSSEDLQLRAELVSQSLCKHASPLPVQQPRLADVPRIVSLADEIGYDCLIEVRRTKIKRAPHCHEPLYQIGRNYHISQAKRRKQRLAEGADVDHACIL